MNPTTTGSDPVRALHDAGGLAARYPEVAQALAAAGPAEVRRAGSLLATVPADTVLAAHPGIPVLDIAVTGSSTLTPLVPALTGELARHGLLGRVRVGDPGAFALDLAVPATADLTLCVLDAGAVFDRFGDAPWTVDDVAAAADDLLQLLTGLVRTHTEHGSGLLLLTTAPLPARWPAQILDLRNRARLGAVWRRFTAALLDLGADTPDTCVLDLDPLLSGTGPAWDPRLATYAHVAHTDAVLDALARQVGHLARGLCGRLRKCLVLDLDGTLWGGTLAESGADGLEMAQGYRGEAHRGFQRAVAQLASQGVLLAVCSKNDPEEVAEVLRTHPDLLLREDAFVTVLADWSPKVDTIATIADRIGIGTDSLVFVDDNSTEAGLVRSGRPEIAVIEVDAADPAGHASRLLADGWFDTTEITEEDRQRAGRYRTEARRAEFRSGFSSLQDYLAELETRVEIFEPGEGDIARLAQLTQRTNQFNLTTRRLDAAGVRTAVTDPDSVVAPVRVSDRFGRHGVVGVLFARRHGTELVIDNLVMSCRVLGRGIESAWLGELLRWAAAGGLTAVTGSYRPTPRNGRVADLYPDHGFRPQATDPDGTSWFRHDLTSLPGPLPHLTVDSALSRPALSGGTP
ncbi:HAD-IIIC family phosphatase [Streptomyces sp. ACA25]|uniref:HAD-IIIC family phosphatase n=1 Tax=Streptomyces sp. ACA25 TaxID=3022596 RepID=UPI00230774E8|nr:HAD-IIIC family phosphatase [Streptomyces sp. ACA25]MDB1089346.1 HAD-IIIC family phosphatase [Streptomyces sp. ACA25]